MNTHECCIYSWKEQHHYRHDQLGSPGLALASALCPQLYLSSLHIRIHNVQLCTHSCIQPWHAIMRLPSVIVWPRTRADGRHEICVGTYAYFLIGLIMHCSRHPLCICIVSHTVQSERNAAFYKQDGFTSAYPKLQVYPPEGGEVQLEQLRARLHRYAPSSPPQNVHVHVCIPCAY